MNEWMDEWMKEDKGNKNKQKKKNFPKYNDKT